MNFLLFRSITIKLSKKLYKQSSNWGEHEPSILFGLLPTKFTASALRHLYEAVYHKKCDVRNFQKKMAGMEYVIPLEEKEQRVAHRAAGYLDSTGYCTKNVM